MDPRTSDSGATFSPDRYYRYRLWRSWGDRWNRIVFVGINPSDANEVDNDHTITKCVGFAERWGFGALDMVNPFGFVSIDRAVKRGKLLRVLWPDGRVSETQ